ncbi:DUF1837 domain-containing protein [Archangium gephyra]|nr:DUF1837 domain-containing protein [Archangium gephyra]
MEQYSEVPQPPKNPKSLIKPPKPKPFLEVRVELLDQLPSLLGLCAGYEKGKWRSSMLARYLINNLIQFAFPMDEWDKATSATGAEMLRRAALTIYQTDKFENRGELGEILLFAIMRTHYDSLPLVSKFYFKSSANDTVKGFDAVHIVAGNTGLELWLGESKFHTSIDTAIHQTLKDLENHLDENYIKNEFMWVEHKTNDNFPDIDKIRQLLDDATSLDQIFPIIHVPILLTYDSPTVAAHSIVNEAYKASITEELKKHFGNFCSKNLPNHVSLHVMLIPLHSKLELAQEFDKKLKAIQDF